MPNNKQISAHLKMKYNTTQSWDTSSLVPQLGEPLLYRDGQTGAIYGLKFGDGVHTPANLEFIGNDIVVDSALSTTSTNPVQNKIITAALGEKQDALTAGNNVVFDGSTILVKSPTCTILNTTGLSFGTGSISNTHGFAIVDVDDYHVTIALIHPGTGETASISDEIIGKYFSIISNSHFAFCGTVTGWDAAGDNVYIYYTPTTQSGTTTSSSTPWWTLQTISGYAPLTHGVLWFPELPELGYPLVYGALDEYCFFEDATSIGYECYASADDAFVSGESNVAGGNHAVIFGKLNKGGYGNIVNGIQNFSCGLHSAVFGRHHTNYGDYNLFGGYGNTLNGHYGLVVGHSHSVAGNGNLISGEHQIVLTGFNGIFGSYNEEINATGNSNLGGGYNNKFSGKCHLFGGRDNSVAGEEHIVGGQDNIVAGGNNIVGGKGNNVTDYYNLVGGQSNTTPNAWNLMGGKGNTIKSAYNIVSGQDNNITNAVKHYNAIFGKNNTIQNAYVLAVGQNHTSYADFQVLLGNGAQADAGAAIIYAYNNTNSFSVGMSGTRSNVNTDAVTVKYFNDHLPSAGTWHSLNGVSSFTINATDYHNITCSYWGLGGTTDDFSTSTIIVGPRTGGIITGTMDENGSYVTASIDSNYNATITAPSGCYFIGYFA